MSRTGSGFAPRGHGASTFGQCLPSEARTYTRAVASDSVVLPLSVAVDRSGLTEGQLVGHWQVQTFTRRFVNDEREPRLPASCRTTSSVRPTSLRRGASKTTSMNIVV